MADQEQRYGPECRHRCRSIIARDTDRAKFVGVNTIGPGETIDLFDIEESPIPIPFGQKKDQIQRNFVVVLVAPTEGDPPNTDHLVCKPKPDSRLSTAFQRLEFFVSRDLHLPVRMVSRYSARRSSLPVRSILLATAMR